MMTRGNNDCVGCDEIFYENDYESVMFRIMRIRHSRDNRGPQRVREKDSVMHIHRKCLAEHVWKVRQYAGSCELADVEVVQWINGEKLTHQLIPVNGNDWGFRASTEGGFMRNYRGFVFNKDVDNLLKKIINEQDLCFVIFFRDDFYSPPVLYPMDDPLIASRTSAPEYKEKIGKAVVEYNKQCVEIKKITKKPKEKILNAGVVCVNQFSVLISDGNDTAKSNSNETSVHVNENAVPASTVDDPIKILKTRYAKGEISKEEFEEMKNALE